ncbi:MAG TPA: LamG domain-containing protein [Victivallales bacterium]|nr:LamG domain-containing protein [Victivallales bacterium]
MKAISLIFILFACLLFSHIVNADNEREFFWEKNNAEIIETGDLKWKPEPFIFLQGKSNRYIDFENGNDNNDGLSQNTAWKHHPWDPNANGKAKESSGIHTYIFKRGVFYRGQLLPKESGDKNNPIRLTSSPEWGDGEASIVGSELIKNWEKNCKNKLIPNPENVWTTTLNFTPRCLWTIDEKGNVKRIPLARTPNWKVDNFDDIKSQWWIWTNPKKPFDNFYQDKSGKQFNMGIDTEHIKGDPNYFKGALVWSEYGWVMGTPFPSKIIAVDTQNSAIAFGGQWSSAPGTTKIIRNCRYYLEDKPQYLDDPEGEFWFEKAGSGGILYLRSPQNHDPNKLHIEAAKYLNLIDAENLNNIEISGLSFKFTNVFWELDAPPFANKDVDPACIRLLGSGKNITIKNCKFEHVNMPIRMKAIKDNDIIDDIKISDNYIAFTDYGAFLIEDGGGWGKTNEEVGRLFDVKILRNNLYMIGMRPTRFGQGHALVVDSAETLEVSGNILDKCYGSGIHIFGSKRSGLRADRPLCRILIYQNKVTDSMLNTNDWGGIETWQGGPAYVFNNISGNPGGFWHWKFKNHPTEPACARFGHAYYLDGAFKNYHFNNIAWGKSSNPYDQLGNTSAFQEIHSYQNTFFNNTIYNFVIGSRRQAPMAGRNKYLSNIWDSIGYMVFRHADPAKTAQEANQADVGKQSDHYAYETNAYANNIFFNVANYDDKSIFGVFESNGRWLKTFNDFKMALQEKNSLDAQLGILTDKSPLRNPQQHDFRPSENSPALNKGAKVFVPWPLYATVGEWNFYHAGNDPADIIDEHWYMTPYYTDRTAYHEQPMFPLKAVNISKDSYVKGELENWCNGALKFNGTNQYAFMSNSLTEWPKKEKISFPKENCNWAEINIPDMLSPDQKTEFTVSLLQDIPENHILQADLHWTNRKNKSAINTTAGRHKINGKGPYKFEVIPKAKPDTENYELILFITPDGTWKNRTHLFRQKISYHESKENIRLRSPQIENDSFIIESYIKIENNAQGIIVEKLNSTGYSLFIDSNGKVNLKIQNANSIFALASKQILNDSSWHHILAECDRKNKKINMYIDGKIDNSSDGPDNNLSLANSADLLVGGSPNGRCLNCTIDFLRISQGSLNDAKTNINELYRWQFYGPFLRDFTGKKVDCEIRSAGAIQF